MISKVKKTKEEQYNLAVALRRYQQAQEKEQGYLQQPQLQRLLPSLPQAIICDIDGTLAIRGDRNIYDFDSCAVDTLCEQICAILINLQKFFKIILLTGREEKFRKPTESWLKSNEISYDKLIMRRLGDNRRDELVKKELYYEEIEGFYNVFFALEDRKRIKRMWVGIGIFVLDVNQYDKEY